MRQRFLIVFGLFVACGDDEPSGQVDASVDASIEASIDGSIDDASTGDAAVQPDADAPFVCDVVAPTSCPEPAPKFADVQPIFVQQCGVCHGKDWTGEWPLEKYSHIADWQDSIRDELVRCSMPPRDSGVVIAREDRMKILNWLRCGLPQ